MKIDKRKNYILMLDTETANTIEEENGLNMDDVLFYDCGWAVIDKWGNVYQTASYVNRDIFVYERDLMHSAYYAKKIPQYVDDIRAGRRKLADLYEIRRAMIETINLFGIKVVCAHNARFDANALNRTRCFISKSKYRYWFPFDSVEWWDTMKMARSVVAKMPSYIKFCEQNKYLTKTGKPKITAEVLYRFIKKDDRFVESHTGLEDVMIEKEILVYCYRQHKSMEKALWDEKREFPQSTEFQKQLMISLKNRPVLRM